MYIWLQFCEISLFGIKWKQKCVNSPWRSNKAGSAIIITDPYGCIEYVNPKFTALSGYSLDEVRGLTPRILKSGHQDQVFYENMWSIIKSGKTWKGELLNRKKNGTLYWEEAIISAVFDTDGHLTDIVAAKEDISERKAIEEREKGAARVYRGLTRYHRCDQYLLQFNQ